VLFAAESRRRVGERSSRTLGDLLAAAIRPIA
jgi:hypothetical protein